MSRLRVKRRNMAIEEAAKSPVVEDEVVDDTPTAETVEEVEEAPASVEEAPKKKTIKNKK